MASHYLKSQNVIPPSMWFFLTSTGIQLQQFHLIHVYSPTTMLKWDWLQQFLLHVFRLFVQRHVVCVACKWESVEEDQVLIVLIEFILVLALVITVIWDITVDSDTMVDSDNITIVNEAIIFDLLVWLAKFWLKEKNIFLLYRWNLKIL